MIRTPERKFPIGLIVVAVSVVAVIAALAVVILLDINQRAASGEPAGTQTIDVPGAQHTTNAVDYLENPPVGGDHDPAWQNCGSYPNPVRNENAVHSLEHGTVWISYAPGLPEEQVQTIRDLASEQTYILASPIEGLDSPVVATAWGKQLQLDDANDPELEQFIRAFRQGPQTPEPGAACTGGVGTPS